MKMNGYRVSHRNKWVLLGLMEKTEFLLFQYLIDITCFDRTKEWYSIAEINVSNITNLFDYSSTNSIYNKLRKLEQIGLISRFDKSWQKVKIVNFERYLLNNQIQKGKAHEYAKKELNQPIEFVFQSIGIPKQCIAKSSQSIANSAQYNQNFDSSKDLDSFKVASNSLDKKQTISKVKSDKHYQELKKENPDLPSAEDMKWIDKHNK